MFNSGSLALHFNATEILSVQLYCSALLVYLPIMALYSYFIYLFPCSILNCDTIFLCILMQLLLQHLNFPPGVFSYDVVIKLINLNFQLNSNSLKPNKLPETCVCCALYIVLIPDIQGLGQNFRHIV